MAGLARQKTLLSQNWVGSAVVWGRGEGASSHPSGAILRVAYATFLFKIKWLPYFKNK